MSLADVGLEAASLDRTVDPCVDFYQFACGGWLAANPIPDDRPAWNRLRALAEQTTEQLGTLLVQSSGPLGDFYKACTDTAAIDAAGLTPIKPILAKLAGVKDAKTWLAAVIELHKLGIDAAWTTKVDPDLHAPTRYITYLDSPLLGLPGRDYYVEPGFADELAAYRAHVGRLVQLADPARAEAAATDVVAIETDLAKLTKTAEQARDIPASYNALDAKKLAKTTKSVDWKAYWKGLKMTPGKQVIVMTPAYFAGLDAVRKKFKPVQWANYFTYHFLARMALVLPQAFDAEMFQLARVTSGVTAQRARSKRCTELTSDALPDLLGQRYVEAAFPAASRTAASEQFTALVAAMEDELGKVAWLAPDTRTAAKAKLAAIARMIGYPDTWRTYSFAITASDAAGNAMRATAAETARLRARAAKPVDRTEWWMRAFTVDAYYDPALNHTALPAGILQPPFFGAKRSVAANLGGIGIVMGHELTHGFDDQGALFDATGTMKTWWTPEDTKQFNAKTMCVADQYATFEVLPKQFINGKLTLGENVADMGGVKMAFRAYRALRANATKRQIADGFDEDQQFFLATAQVLCSRERKTFLEQELVNNPHSPPKFRVYGALRNLPEFAAAYKCAPGTPMNPSQTCTVW